MFGKLVKNFCGASLVMIMGCEISPDYHEYKPTPAEGWEQGDVVTFSIDSIRQDGDYSLDIGVRVTETYPFQTLYLLVEQSFANPVFVTKDTLRCRLTQSNGDKSYNGISAMQHTYPLRINTLREGQQGTISIQHIMRREILPGILDVGIHLDKK